MKLSGVLLAAGGSRRLGRPKQLLVWQGETLVRRAARAALDAGVDELLVVTGANADAVSEVLEGLDARIVRNDRWTEGLGSSIGCGVRAASGDGVLLLLADQPAVDAALLARLIAGARDGHRRAACAYEGALGVPAVFCDPKDLAILRSLSGDQGAKRLLASEPGGVFAVSATEASIDIDDEADWTSWCEEGDRSAG